MWKWKVILLFLAEMFVSGVNGDCACYEANNVTGKSAPISNSYMTEDFSPCYLPCSYVAYSGDETYGWTGLVLNWKTTTNSGGIIQIFDGPSATGTPIIQVAEGETIAAGIGKSLIKSSLPVITIKYSQTGSGASMFILNINNGTFVTNVYYGSISTAAGLAPIAVSTTTTAMPTTRSYSNPNFAYDPYFITHDIFVVINQRTSGGMAALTSLNALAINFVTLLSTTTDINSVSSSRLSLATLTPYDPYYSVQGGIWELSATDVLNNVPRSGVTIEGDIDSALIGLADLAFTVNKNASTDTRNNVQRSVVLLTAEWPSNALLGDNVASKFTELGLNLLVVGYNLTDAETSQLLRTDRWYNAINSSDSKITNVAAFVNPFYFNNGANNFWCPPFGITNSVDGTYSWFQEPYNYTGPHGINGVWTDPFDGQTGRYCNFANNQYVYQNNAGGSVKVQVYFELEAGKDFLNFYDASNNLIASFTGYEIAGSSFFTSTTTLTARFTSDNKSIFRGFWVSITPQP